MKLIVKTLALLSLLLAAPTANATPDITELLKNAAENYKQEREKDKKENETPSSGKKGLADFVEGLLGKKDITIADLAGTWHYSAPAIAFQSENFLQQAGGVAAAKIIEDKLQPYYNRAGLDQLTITFENDSTFTFKMRRLILKGNLEKDSASTDPSDYIFNFTAAKRIPIGKAEAKIKMLQPNKLTITFDVSRLITLVNNIAAVSGRKSLQSVASVLNSYDGLNCGFDLAPEVPKQ